MSFHRWRKSMQLLLLAAFPLAGADFKPVAERIQEQIMNRFADSHGIITDYRGLKGEIVLPTPEECERNIPNAKGYWTPIENGGFFTGLYLLGQAFHVVAYLLGGYFRIDLRAADAGVAHHF